MPATGSGLPVAHTAAAVAASNDGSPGETALMAAAPAHAISEADRLWLVGERAFQDGLAGLSRRNLERFCENLHRYRAGEELLGVVDKRAGY